MCHCPSSLDASSFQDPPHSLFLFLTLLTLVSPWPFLKILVTHFCISCSFSFFWPSPFPSVLLSRLVLGPSPIGIVSACFWSYTSTRKQSTLYIIEVGMGGKPPGFIFCLLWGVFSNPSSSFIRCIDGISFHRVLSRVFMERMRLFW